MASSNAPFLGRSGAARVAYRHANIVCTWRMVGCRAMRAWSKQNVKNVETVQKIFLEAAKGFASPVQVKDFAEWIASATLMEQINSITMP